MSPPPATVTPPNSPGAQHVLDVARVLFAEHGIDAVSMQDIATQAGVSKANVFHHFASKEALYIAVIRACTQYKNAMIAELVASPAPFEQRFFALLKGQLQHMADDPSGTRLVIREVTNGNIERAKLIATQIFSEQIRDRLAFFEDARARGELREGVEPHVCDMLLGACCMFHFNCGEVSKHISTELGTVMPATIDGFARTICNALVNGLGVSPAKPARKAKAATQKISAPRRNPSRSTRSL
ncbi:MAG: TetR/AcrR family transcriptional regulator [Stagnimonas sp.]|nr:TetR/AcrR family transcriptional regulator [Stagnimonas sp.]